MDDNKEDEVQRSERLKALLVAAAGHREPPVMAHTFLRRWPSYSKPVALACGDGREYVVKTRQAGRAIVNDHVLAHLGFILGAPVGAPKLVDIPTELTSLEPQLTDLPAGIAHGTLFVRNCSDRQWIMHANVMENRNRFALLAVLYGWGYAGDTQLIYGNDPPHLVYSVDHGHFFPGGPNWQVSTLAQAAPAHLEQSIVSECGLTEAEQKGALLALRSINETAIIRAVAAPPEDWEISLDERVALVIFFLSRRQELLASFTDIA